MIHRFAVLLLLTSVTLSAQITLDANDLRAPIGSRLVIESVTFNGALSETPIDIQPGGANLPFDLSGPLEGPLRIELRASIIPIDQAPGGDRYPEADYAAQYEILNPDGSTAEMVVYFERSETTDVVVGIDGAGNPFPADPATIPLPLTYGSQWSDIVTLTNSEVVPGVRSVGSVTQSGTVDAWGTVSTPAGGYPYLRIHTSAVGSLAYQGDPDLEALGPIDLVTEGFSWNTPYLGAVVSVAHSTVTFRNGGPPPVVSTQVLRLLEASGIPSVVAEIGWGQMKSIQLRGR